MADRVISTTGAYTGYNAAVGIDAANDYMLIQQSGVYNKINRNVALGLTSAPLGTTDSQSPTNKTFNNTNVFTIKDGSLTLQNTSSATKQAIFSLASITAGQTRTLTIPDASLTIVGTTTTQTLTNKTLTSPVINGGTIDNSTVTVDTISGHTSATIVTIASLQISSGVLNTANAVTATSIADAAVTPAKLIAGTGSGWTWAAWTPSWTNITVGNGTSTGYYIQTGKTINYWAKLTFGTTTAVTGAPYVSFPVTTSAHYDYSQVTGFISYKDVSAVSFFKGECFWDTTGRQALYHILTNGTYASFEASSSSAPFTFATGDIIGITGSFEAA